MKTFLLSLFLSLAILCGSAHATLDANAARDTYTASGSNNTFTYTFKLLDKSHIAVYLDEVKKVLDVDYTVTSIGSASGSIVFTTNPAASTQVLFLRSVPRSQSSNYVLNESFPSDRVEQDYDKLWMALQEANEKIARLYSLTVGQTMPALPNKCAGGQKMDGYDAFGQISCATDLNAAAATANQWDQITAPSGNTSLAMGANLSTFTWNADTGANPPFRLSTGASNAGTGALLQLDTAGGTGIKPFQATAGGTADGVQMNTTGSLQAIGAGDIKATSLDIPGASVVTTFDAIDPLTTKGDILTHNGTNSIRLPVCADGVSLVADSAQASGWVCGTPDVAQTVLVVKTADETINDAVTGDVLQNDDELLCAVAANKRYLVEIIAAVSAANTTADFKTGWTLPAGATMVWGPQATLTGTTNVARYFGSTTIGQSPTALLTAGGTYSFGSAAVTGGLTLWGLVSTAGTSGNVQFQWAQNQANASDSKFLAGSVLRCTLLN